MDTVSTSSSVGLAGLSLNECDAKQAEFQLPQCRAISAPQLLMDCVTTKTGKAGQLVGASEDGLPTSPCTPSPSYGSLLKRTLKGTNASKRKFYDSGEAMLLQQGRPLDDTVACGLTLDQLQSLPKVYRTRFA